MYMDLIKNNRGGAGTKAIIGVFVSLALIVVIIGGVFGYFWNATPNDLKIADKELFNGKSLSDLGLENVKIKDIYKQFRDLINTDTQNIVTNEPGEQDKTDTNTNFEGVSDGTIPSSSDGSLDYSVVVTTPLVYNSRYQQRWNDTSLAYLFDQIVSGIADNAAVSTEGVQFLRDINASIEEITITCATDETAKMRLVFSINTSLYKDQIKQQLGVLGDIVPIPDTLYVVSYFSISADADNQKKIKTTSENIKINDEENALSSALFNLLSGQIGGSEDMSEDQQKALINDKIGLAFSTILINLGDLGEGTTESGTNEISDVASIEYGDVAIHNGYLSLITRVE